MTPLILEDVLTRVHGCIDQERHTKSTARTATTFETGDQTNLADRAMTADHTVTTAQRPI